jgi:hypothetical protein
LETHEKPSLIINIAGKRLVKNGPRGRFLDIPAVLKRSRGQLYLPRTDSSKKQALAGALIGR